ncbi:unnamed protein product [Dracunculus medinensis]|uniref:Innexin n=1 Tax=Dracunculus medinensis TaxID=318479 RepID=A0A0N4UM06_DRAME|nr:unnamed protein product [Dracunculus medinensis]
MDRLAKLIESITKPRYEEDFIDRLNYHCWLPSELSSQQGWEQYAENFCFVENTYYVPITEDIPKNSEQKLQKQLTYYQWIPFLLIFQAFLFTVPHIFWRMLNWTTGIYMKTIISMANNARNENLNKKRNETIIAIANHLYHALGSDILCRRATHSNPFIAVVRQFRILSTYLGVNGYELTKAVFEGRTWELTGLFPRVTMCDFRVRAMGNHHHHTIQCVLMTNMFNEKICIALWWWILVLMTSTSVNLFYWLFVMASPTFKRNYLLDLIKLGGIQGGTLDMDKALNDFVFYLGNNGILVIRLMALNAGDLITSEVVAHLFKMIPSEKYILQLQKIKKELITEVYNIHLMKRPPKKKREAKLSNGIDFRNRLDLN